MRNVPVLLTAVLLAAVVPAPASSATKYKPCTLLTTADLEGALKAKLTKAQGEYEVIEDEGPLKGEAVDGCAWIFGSGSDTIGVVLRVSRAVASVHQMADYVFTPLEESARKDGVTVKRAQVGGVECTIDSNIKGVGLVKNSMLCLTAGKGRALTIEINTSASTPVPTAVAQGLLAKAIARLP